MCWICLFLAIFLEVAATIFMKLSNGFTRVVPTVAMFTLYGLSFLPMNIALKQMELGAVYAIWSAVGTAAVAGRNATEGGVRKTCTDHPVLPPGILL